MAGQVLHIFERDVLVEQVGHNGYVKTVRAEKLRQDGFRVAGYATLNKCPAKQRFATLCSGNTTQVSRDQKGQYPKGGATGESARRRRLD